MAKKKYQPYAMLGETEQRSMINNQISNLERQMFSVELQMEATQNDTEKENLKSQYDDLKARAAKLWDMIPEESDNAK